MTGVGVAVDDKPQADPRLLFPPPRERRRRRRLLNLDLVLLRDILQRGLPLVEQGRPRRPSQER